MEALARLATRRPVAVTVLGVTAALLGWVAAGQLPVDLLPDIQSPTVVVSVRSGDRPPVEMERLYGEQVEQRLFTVRGIREVSQVARTGRLVASVVFEWDADMDLALVEVQKAIGPVAADPEVDEVLVRRFDPRQEPVLTLGLVAPSGEPDLAELRRIAERQVGPGLERLAGVAEVRVLGGREKEAQVLLDVEELEAHGLTLAELEGRLQAANVDIEAGTLEEGSRVYLVRGLSRFRSLEDIEAVVVRHVLDARGRRVALRVSDIAEVSWRDREIDHLVRVGGVEGVGLSIYKEAGANTVSVSQTLRDSVAALEQDLPSVRVQVVRDEAALVEDAIADLESAAALGIVLAVVVLALFLRSAGPTVVVASAVPVSLLSALFFMRLGGQSLNVVTLAGLALGAGMLVDNAIVVVESIHRRLARGEPSPDAAALGAADVAGAIAASTLTTCVVFVPVLFVSGLAARLISGIAFAVIVSLSASLAVAVLLIPALSGWLLRSREPAEEAEAAPAPGARRVEELVRRLTGRPLAVVSLAALLAVGAAAWLVALGTELLPPADPAQFSLRLVGPPGMRVEATAETVATIEDVLREAAGSGLEAIQSEVGRVPEDDRLITSELTEENTARILVRLTGDATSSRVVARAAPVLTALPEMRIEWEVGTSALARVVASGPPIAVEIYGQSTDDLRLGADRVHARLRERPELWNVDSSFEGGPPELHVVLDRALADGLGVDIDTATRVLEAALDGRRATLLTLGDEERRVVLRTPSPRIEELGSLRFTSPSGARLALGQIAQLVPAEGAREIFRRDQRRVARVTARLAEGVDYPAAVAATREALDGTELPPGLRARLAGEEEERQETFDQLAGAGVLAVVLVLMVLAGTFESLVHPWTVLASIPLAAVGVALLLGPAGHPVGVMAMLGLIVLAGIAVNDAILLVATAQQIQESGDTPREAVARAAAVRLRPILMTTLTTVVALLPLALGTSEAARLRSPMALAIIGGILASTAASLSVIPCLYTLLERRRGR